MDRSPRHEGAPSRDTAPWSPTSFEDLVTAGRTFAENVLVHLERLERLDANSDPRDLADANIYLESALLDFQDAQIAHTGSGFGFIDDPDSDGSRFEGDDEVTDVTRAATPDTEERTPSATDGYGSPEASEGHDKLVDGQILSVMTRHDFELSDPQAVQDTAQEFATMAGATPVPEGDIGYAMAILNYMGLAQLTTTPGLRPLLEVNAISTRAQSPDKQEIDAAEGVERFFDAGNVLNSQTNMWSPEPGGGSPTTQG